MLLSYLVRLSCEIPFKDECIALTPGRLRVPKRPRSGQNVPAATDSYSIICALVMGRIRLNLAAGYKFLQL